MAAGKNPFDDEERTVAMPLPSEPRPPRPAAKAVPKVHTTPTRTSSTSTELPKVSATPAPAAPKPAPPPKPLPPVVAPPRTASGRFASSFGEENTQIDLVMGRARPAKAAEPSISAAELRAVASRFDGTRPSPSVEIPAAELRPIAYDATSQPGARHPVLTRAVLDQFAPETNSRYAQGECGQVFVWDFTQAMGCATPRWKRNVELTLQQVCAWFRSLSNAEGWIRITSVRALELLKSGHPVIAMPKTAGASLLAVARPEDVDADGTPLLASACSRRRGNRLTTREAFGQRHADYYFHP